MVPIVGDERRAIAVEVDPPDRATARGPRVDRRRAGGPARPGRRRARAAASMPASGSKTTSSVVGEPEGRRAPGSSSAPGHPPVGDADRGQAGGDPVDVIDARRAERDAAGPEVERLAGVGLQLSPGAEGVEHQPGVGRVGVGMPGDPGRAVRAAPVVAEGELLDQEDRLAAPGQVVGGGRAHRPGAEDDVRLTCCVVGHRCQSAVR